MPTFSQSYDAIVVFGNYRYGSSALCDMLLRFLASQGLQASDWNEFLHNNKWLTNADRGLISDTFDADRVAFGDRQISYISAACPGHVMRAKLEFWQRKRQEMFIIFKVDHDDFAHGNDEYIHRYILDDPRVYKIGLNRASVDQALISYMVGNHHNIWNDSEDALRAMYQRPVTPVLCDPGVVQGYIDGVIRHNSWLLYSSHRLNTSLWYEDLHDMQLPDLGFFGQPVTHVTKHTMDHADRARKFFVDGDQLLDTALQFRSDMSRLLRSVADTIGHPRSISLASR